MGCTLSHRVKRCGSLSTSQFASPPSALLLMIRSPIDWFRSSPLNPPDRDNSQLIDSLTPLRSAPLSLATIGRSVCIRTSVKSVCQMRFYGYERHHVGYSVWRCFAYSVPVVGIEVICATYSLHHTARRDVICDSARQRSFSRACFVQTIGDSNGHSNRGFLRTLRESFGRNTSRDWSDRTDMSQVSVGQQCIREKARSIDDACQ